MFEQSSYLGKKTMNIDNDTEDIARKFSKMTRNSTGYLVYRDIPQLIKKYVSGNKALDYGCGTGYSTSILHQLGFNVLGTDISAHMLKLAKENHKNIEFCQAEIGKTPFDDNSFDLVISTLVLFDIPSFEDMVKYLQEARRVLKKNGIFIAVTGSENLHKNNWTAMENDVEKNLSLKPGDTYSIKLTDADIIFNDFYYCDKTYNRAFYKAKMSLIETQHPLGKPQDDIEWTTEWKLSPYVIYVCSKLR